MKHLLPHQVAPSGDDGDILKIVGGVTEWSPPSGSGLPPGGADGEVLTKQSGTDFDADWEAAGGGSTIKTATFKIAGALGAGAGVTRLYNDTGTAWTLSSIRATVETAPSGGSVVVDVNKSGTTVFTTQANRPTITTGNLTSGKVTAIDVTSVPDGDYLTVDVDTTTAPTANLTVTVVFT